MMQELGRIVGITFCVAVLNYGCGDIMKGEDDDKSQDDHDFTCDQASPDGYSVTHETREDEGGEADQVSDSAVPLRNFQESVMFGPEKMYGSTVGNGGDVVVCRDPATEEIIDIELLDFYEARIRGLAFDIKYDDMETEVVVASWLTESAFAGFDPDRSTQYMSWAKDFMAETVWLPEGTILQEIDDSEHVHVPEGCKVEQLIVQREVGKHRYYIKQELWNALDTFGHKMHQAGAILHEIVYREAITYQHDSSFNARYLVGAIASTFLDSSNLKEYTEMVESLDFPATEKYEGHVFKLGTLQVQDEKFSGILWQPTDFYFLGIDPDLYGGEMPEKIRYRNHVTISKTKRKIEVGEFWVLLEGEVGERVKLFGTHARCSSKTIQVKKGDVIKFDKNGWPIALNDLASFDLTLHY